MSSGQAMERQCEHVHLEHDGKLLLVDMDGNGPGIPRKGRTEWEGGEFLLRLPTPDEARTMGLTWKERREHWAWKDAVISDSAVDPVARESVYRTLHRVVSKVAITNPEGRILMVKVTRGFFTGCWTLPGGFVDYAEHPRKGAEREALEELGINISIADPKGESGDAVAGDDGALIQEAIFQQDGINWISFTYRCHADIRAEDIVPKDDEIEEARWFTRKEALSNAVSLFDIEAIVRIDQ